MDSIIEMKCYPKVGADSDSYWSGFEESCCRLMLRMPLMTHVIKHKKSKSDQWHLDNPAKKMVRLICPAYKQFLKDIDYLLPEGDDFYSNDREILDEIAHIAAGPQPLSLSVTRAMH
jgi:malate synthase